MIVLTCQYFTDDHIRVSAHNGTPRPKKTQIQVDRGNDLEKFALYTPNNWNKQPTLTVKFILQFLKMRDTA